MTTTLTAARQRSAKELGYYESGTATSGSSTSSLECTSWPFQSTIDKTDEYQDKWLFRPAAIAAGDKVRFVKTYNPTNGTMTPDKSWTNAAYTGGAGEAFELHGIIEPLTALKDLINTALLRIMVPVEATITAADATRTRHSLSTLTWLLDGSWIRQVGWLSSGETRANVDPFTGRVVRGTVLNDGGTLYLQTGAFATTDTIYIRALKPAYYHCAAAAGALGSQSGLNLESDICYPVESWIAASVLVEAWKRYGHLLEGNAAQRLLRDRGEAAAWFTDETRKHLQVPELTYLPYLSSWGPRR